jgi:hypothetical protein
MAGDRAPAPDTRIMDACLRRFFAIWPQPSASGSQL